MKNPIFFIVNSRIGEQKMKALHDAVLHYFPDQTYEIHATEYGGHAKVLAQEAKKKGIEKVVAVGGDGTVNEVIQVMANSGCILGIVPTGSGNGLARHCSIPLSIHDAVGLVAEGKSMFIDLGKANDIFFISNAGVGFDATVCNTIKQTKSRGLKMYIKKVTQHFFTYKPVTYTINIDGQEMTRQAFFLNVANGKEFGYGFQIAPKATLQDGILDMILVEKITVWNSLSFVLDGWRRRLKHNKNCMYIRAKKIIISSKQMVCFQTDGDAHDCNGRCEIEVFPNALNLIVPHNIESL